ncbi:hypothetical protein [Actinomadura luteofluorescens]
MQVRQDEVDGAAARIAIHTLGHGHTLNIGGTHRLPARETFEHWRDSGGGGPGVAGGEELFGRMTGRPSR